MENENTHYGLPIVDNEDCEFAIAFTEKAANQAAKEYIKDSLWAFNADFIAKHCKVLSADVILTIQQGLCETDANAAFHELIEDIDQFVDDAIGAYGRGYFLAFYDNEENLLEDIDPDDVQVILEELREEIETGLGMKCLVYRLN
ncbi:hypothetical protein NEA10_20685 (plasmid) [Phormidium yuhuli AB48]|jgi:hypothetical protein|uniref:Uncharacterized protein n=1 Tax=Phormidium yuhuli AB48 TaxID=2940671 RepID=A0ABY5AWT2_9CYAN|nr:hypothetical protein [Phormidium yuhuli]USR93263.1 hypothetical protein NEA10_20685 [Phormidium yuhuli AB48]